MKDLCDADVISYFFNFGAIETGTVRKPEMWSMHSLTLLIFHLLPFGISKYCKFLMSDNRISSMSVFLNFSKMFLILGPVLD